MAHYLDSIMHPRTIAVIGASKDSATRGYGIIQSLVSDHYVGEIFPVNPDETKILGFACYPMLADVAQDIDLAIVCTPAQTLPAMVEDCGKKGVKGAVLLAGGFSEANKEGRLLEEETVAMARKYNVRLIGSDTNGLFTARLGCNASGHLEIPHGPLAMLSNSASVLRSLMTEVRFHGYTGISAMLSGTRHARAVAVCRVRESGRCEMGQSG